MVIREIRPEEIPALEEFLYQAIFVPEGVDAPERMFEPAPSRIERLQGDGSWKPVAFARLEGGAVRLASPVLPQRPAIFRWK